MYVLIHLGNINKSEREYKGTEKKCVGNIRKRDREAETQAEGVAGSMHQQPDVGFDPGSPGSRPGPKAGAKPLRHPGIPILVFLKRFLSVYS